MDNLTDEEVLCLIDQLNQVVAAKEFMSQAVGEAFEPDEAVLRHRNSGRSARLVPLLKKFLDEAVERGLIKVPPCFGPREQH